MKDTSPEFLLPREIERHLATLSKMYALGGDREMQELVVNSQIRVHEGFTYDNWNGGTYGHALYLLLPEQIFAKVGQNIEGIKTKILNDLNKIQNIQNEHVSNVFIEMMIPENEDWRSKSGLLITGSRIVSDAACERIWKNGYYRLFLSHKTEVKGQTAVLSKTLEEYGISSFVAHENIQPTEEWQNEIENALATMDGFLAVMTPDFHESNWTDQEVGFAFARKVPMIALSLGKDPYGFIGKFQALRASWDDAPAKIVKILIKNERMFSAWLKAIRECKNYAHGNLLSELLPSLNNLTENQIDELLNAYNQGGQIAGSYGFIGGKKEYGDGLVFHLNRLSKRKFVRATGERIEVDMKT